MPLPVGIVGKTKCPLLPGWARQGGWFWPSCGCGGKLRKHIELCSSHKVRPNSISFSMEKARSSVLAGSVCPSNQWSPPQQDSLGVGSTGTQVSPSKHILQVRSPHILQVRRFHRDLSSTSWATLDSLKPQPRSRNNKHRSSYFIFNLQKRPQNNNKLSRGRGVGSGPPQPRCILLLL